MFFKKRPLYIIDKQMKKSFKVFFVFEKKGQKRIKIKTKKILNSGSIFNVGAHFFQFGEYFGEETWVRIYSEHRCA